MFSAPKIDDSLNDINVLKATDHPADTVSSISWAPVPSLPMFACSDWDSKIRLYETQIENESPGIVQKSLFSTQEPCLSTDWNDDVSKLLLGSIDNSVQILDVIQGKFTVIGKHEAGVKDVYWLPNLNVLCSLSFDKTLKLWDPRQENQIFSLELDRRIYCSDLMFPYLIVGGGHEKVVPVNLLTNPIQMLRAVPYCHQPNFNAFLNNKMYITSIACSSDGKGFVAGTLDGKAYFNQIEFNQAGDEISTLYQTVELKCHSTSTTAYPIHCMGFHPNTSNVMYTAGANGEMIFWDYPNERKIKTFKYDKVPVVKAKISPNGEHIAYALGYDWTRGIHGSKSVESKVCVHTFKEEELNCSSSSSS